jgi:hypothetical protein
LLNRRLAFRKRGHDGLDILVALVVQQTQSELKVSRYWEKVKAKAREKEKLPLQILPFPT